MMMVVVVVVVMVVIIGILWWIKDWCVGIVMGWDIHRNSAPILLK